MLREEVKPKIIYDKARKETSLRDSKGSDIWVHKAIRS